MSELGELIEAELRDPAHTGRTHGTASCYRSGCRGVLCRFGNRTRWRAKYGRSPDGYSAVLDLEIEKYMANRQKVSA